jgi:hypothetical protein
MFGLKRGRAKSRIGFAAVATVLMSLAGVGLAGSASAATTLIVDDNSACAGAGYTSILDAAIAASDGDTIQVCPGTYSGFTDDGKALTFVGPQHDVNPSDYPTAAGEAIVDGGGSDAIELFKASTLNGFTVQNASRGVIADGGSTVKSNKIAASDSAVQTGDNVVVSHNVLSSDATGVSFDNGAGSGTEISDNVFSGTLSTAAIDQQGSFAVDPAVNTLSVLRNSYKAVTNTGHFLDVTHTDGLTVEGNILDGAGVGGSLVRLHGDDHDWSITGNSFSNSTDAAVVVFCYLGASDNAGGGAVTQNLFDHTQGSIELLNTGADCTGTFEVHSNVFDSGNPNPGPGNEAIANFANATVNAQNNFFGCNGGPGTTGCSSNIGADGTDRYLVLKSTIGTKTLSPGQTTPFVANLNHNNLGETVATPVLDGVPISFSASTYLTVTPASGHVVGGVAGATVKAKTTPGGQSVTGQSVSARVVNAVTTQSPITIKASAPPPPLPALSIADASTAEGRSGTHVVYFPVTLSKKSAKAVAVKFATANGSAKSPTDFVAKSGTLTIPAGATKAYIGITIKGDKAWEPNESFFVTLYSPVNATVADPNGTGIIRNS